MKTKLQRVMCALFAIMVCASMNAQTSGNCGYPNAADVQWSYDGGTLTFTGTGAMNMYSEDYPQAPWWNDYYETATTVVVGEGITTIPHWAFAMFEHLTSVSLPSTLTTIGKAAFEECAFTTINLPEGLETIGDYAFQMTPLTSVTIPSTVTSIGEVAFQANDALTYVICLAATPPTMGDNVFQACSNLTGIFVPAASVDAYKAADGWSAYAAKINAKFFTAVGDYQWATFFDDSKAYEVDANTTVYKASLTSTTLTLTAVGGNQIISAGNAVVLRSTSAPVLTETATASTADFSGNELHGSASPVASDGTLYALSYKSGTLGFFKVKSGTSIPAGKAYLSTADAAREYFEFTYGDDATSIESVASSHQTIANGQYYDMQGRKVFKPTKGLYIVNGKKVIVKKIRRNYYEKEIYDSRVRCCGTEANTSAIDRK